MKKIILAFFIIALILTAFLVKNTFVKEKTWPHVEIIPANREIKIIIASDIHFLASDLLEPRSSFHQEIKRGDGKMPHYSTQILAAFLDEVIRVKPAALILSGDITFNGEKRSHVELAQYLKKVREEGIPVLVIPGNHDINIPNTYLFSNNGRKPVPNISERDFWELYSPLGAIDAVSFDKSSLSYVYQLSEDLQIMMIDTSQYEKGMVKTGGRINEKTLAWMEKNLSKAKKSGISVITVTHHSLLPHSSLFTSDFTLENYPQVLNILEKYGVLVNLSGHIHIQHIVRANEIDGIYDIATSSLTVYPNHYGILDINTDKSILYTANTVNVSKYAENTGIDDENLLNFDKYSFEFMSQTTFYKIRERLAQFNISVEEKTAMIDFVQMLNVHYFAGIPLEITVEDKIYKLWSEYFPSGFHTRYLNSILKENDTQSTTLFIPSARKREQGFGQ